MKHLLSVFSGSVKVFISKNWVKIQQTELRKNLSLTRYPAKGYAALFPAFGSIRCCVSAAWGPNWRKLNQPHKDSEIRWDLTCSLNRRPFPVCYCSSTPYCKQKALKSYRNTVSRSINALKFLWVGELVQAAAENYVYAVWRVCTNRMRPVCVGNSCFKYPSSTWRKYCAMSINDFKESGKLQSGKSWNRRSYSCCSEARMFLSAEVTGTDVKAGIFLFKSAFLGATTHT